jgi:hypothetical protein
LNTGKHHPILHQTQPTMTSISDKNQENFGIPKGNIQHKIVVAIDYDRLYNEGKLDDWIAQQTQTLHRIKTELKKN